MAQMVFVALDRRAARHLRETGSAPGPWVAHAATPALLQAHGYDESALEDAEFAALSYAGIQSVALRGEEALRLVVAAELEAGRIEPARDDAYGQVTVSDLRWSDVRALFVDDPAAAPAVAAARPDALGRSVTDALAHPSVATLLDEHDLLWFAPEELDSLST
jgi:hypothetical protein